MVETKAKKGKEKEDTGRQSKRYEKETEGREERKR